MSDQVKEVYITRYWETRGIYRMKVTPSESFPEMVNELDNRLHTIFKPYWYDTEAEAIAHAESLRLKKIKATDKKLEKLKKLTFKAPGN